MRELTLIAGTEIRLMTREWAAMVFAFGFPALLLLVLGSVFGDEPSPAYGGATPSEYYIADYVAVPLGALTLIGLPVAIASYRERQVMRRFRAAGVGEHTVIAAQAAVTWLLVLVAIVVVLIVGAIAYGIPEVHDAPRALTGLLVGAVVMTLLGVSLGLVSGTARSAQALGLLAFFPMWLLGAGGPPRVAMPDLMADISDVLPLGNVSDALRRPWLGTGGTADNLVALGLWFLALVVVLLVLARARRRADN